MSAMRVKKSYKLTQDDRAFLSSCGYSPETHTAIKRALSIMQYTMFSKLGENSINVSEAMDILGKEQFLRLVADAVESGTHSAVRMLEKGTFIRASIRSGKTLKAYQTIINT